MSLKLATAVTLNNKNIKYQPIDSSDDRDYILINGTEFGDTLSTGSTGNHLIYAGAGNDTVNLLSNGRDIVYGGIGNDTIRSRVGNDTIYAQDGNDSIVVYRVVSTGAPVSNVFIDAGAGNDDLVAGQLANGNRVKNIFFDGGSGDDNAYLVGNSSTILGGDGNDRIDIYFSRGPDGGHHNVMDGGDGNDWIRANNTNTDAAETVFGGLGDDTIYAEGFSYSYGGDGNDTLDAYSFGGDVNVAHMYGGNGNDVLTSITSNDKLFGDAGDDRFVISSGSQFLSGGTGNDTFTFFYAFGSPTNRFGNDTITDFDIAGPTSGRLDDVDTIDFSRIAELSFENLVFTQIQDGTLITFNNVASLEESSILLVGISASSITSDIFTFA